MDSKMVGFHGKPLSFCSSDLQTCSQFLHVQDNIRGLVIFVPVGCYVFYNRYDIIYKYASLLKDSSRAHDTSLSEHVFTDITFKGTLYSTLLYTISRTVS